ncbi:hypothetical protein GOACH_24_00050 [Gordonia aichiensis NBRC 108223]|uniref:Uncharacterized protein n=1 Tax=Gordonia aichiensis NBRC 108223 TaxID=1220583 RepID=L7KP35_9ACTN|nr:hypothetical protein GOACH_24_00050 [Gordonia aichiensis NBRC 108223]
MDDERNSLAYTYFAGLLCAIAAGQLAIAAGSPTAGGPFSGGIIAIVASLAMWARATPLRTAITVGAEWFFSLISVIALVPALLAIFTGDCGGGTNVTGAILTMVVFMLAFTCSLIFFLYRGLRIGQLRYIGLGLFGFVEMVLFWSEPASRTFLGDESGVLLIAIAAALLSGVVIAIAPHIGMTLLGAVTALGAILGAANETATACTAHDGTPSALGLVTTYLVVAGLLGGLAARRQNR